MGITPSTPSHAFTQLYLPADCFHLCTPDSCFCRGGHHSRSKYVYVERNNPSGRESYRDPMELMERGLLPPPGWGMGSMRDWRPKDWDVMNRVLTQWMANQRGITEVPWSEMGLGNQMMGWGGGGLQGGFGGDVPPYPHVPPPWAAWQGGWQNGPPNIGSGGRRGEGAIDEEMREKIRILHDITFGSEADRQEKQMQEQMLKRLQPMIPELAKLIALQQAGLSTGHGLNGNGNGGAMMPGAPPGMGMGGVGMPGMMGGGLPGMNPMMHPLAAMGGMNPMMTGADAGMMGGGVDLGGGPGRRRGRGRRPMRDFDFDDDDEDDFGGFGRGRGGRRRRRGRYNLDDDDLFGDRGGDDSRGREPPPRGPRPRPQPGSGNGNGGGGAVFDTFNDDAHYRTGPLTAHHPAQLTASPLRNSAPQAVPTMATAPPNRILTPVEEPLSTSPPPIPITRPSATDRSYVPPGAIPILAEGAPPYRSFPGTYDMADPSGYPSVPVSDQRPTSRRAHFHPEAGLTRPRQEEENRGEAPAGGPVGAHDITPL